MLNIAVHSYTFNVVTFEENEILIFECESKQNLKVLGVEGWSCEFSTSYEMFEFCSVPVSVFSKFRLSRCKV